MSTHRPLQLATPLGPDALQAVTFEGREAISESFRFRVEAIADRRQPVEFSKLLGHPVSVGIRGAGGRPRFFHGICVRMSQGKTDTSHTHYRLEIAPQFELWRQRKQSRIFQQMTVPDILKQVLAPLDVSYPLTGKYEKRDYCVQYRESDFDFASRLMEEEGIYYFFRHTEQSHRMYVADAPTAHPAVEGGDVTLRTLEHSSVQTDDYIYDFDKTQDLTTGRVTLWDHTFELPHRNLAAERPVRPTVTIGKVEHELQGKANRDLEYYDWPGQYAQRFDGVSPGGGDRKNDVAKVFDDGPRTANLRAEEIAVSGLLITGWGHARQLASGHRFTLKAEPNDQYAAASRADGDYVVTAVEHKASIPHYRSGSKPSGGYCNSFTCIPAELQFRPQRLTEKPIIPGTQTAEVVGPAGEEIFTDKYGRVKVKFHWDRHGRRDGSDSCWVRVAQVHAGRGWGGIDVPRIGEELVIAFEEGDPDRPIAVGRVYNAREMPPFPLPAKAMVSGMKSNTTPGGGGFNEISLDDSKGKERMFIHAQYNQDSIIGNNRTAKVGVDSAEQVGNNVVQQIGKDQSVAVGNNQSTTVGANIVIQAGTSITLKCGAAMIHMNQAGVISITGTLVTMAGSIMANVAAPITNVSGGALLTQSGAINLNLGGAVEVAGGAVGVHGGIVNINT